MRTVSVLLWVLCASLAASVEPQPFLAATQRLMDAGSLLGTPFNESEIQALRAAISQNDQDAVAKAKAVLDGHALFHVTITPKQRVKVERGAAKPFASARARTPTPSL